MKVIVLAVDELMRLLSTRRGYLSLGGFALIWAAVLLYGVLPASRFLGQASDSGLVDLIPEDMSMSSLQDWPTPELAIYWIVSLYLLPFLAILTAADQTASDRARGTLRYLVLRCSRLEIFFGRYIGQLFILFLVVLITLGSVLVIVAINSSDQFAPSLASSAVIVINLMLVLSPFVALMALASVLAKSARQATLFAVILWLVALLLAGYLVRYLPNPQLLGWMLPGSQVGSLTGLSDWQTLVSAPVPVAQTLVLLSVGAFIIWKRDL